MRTSRDGCRRQDLPPDLFGDDPVPSPSEELGHRDEQLKYVKLCAGFGAEGTTWIYANPEALVNAAVTGVFTPTARWDFWNQPREKRLASEKDKPLYDGDKPMVS